MKKIIAIIVKWIKSIFGTKTTATATTEVNEKQETSNLRDLSKMERIKRLFWRKTFAKVHPTNYVYKHYTEDVKQEPNPDNDLYLKLRNLNKLPIKNKKVISFKKWKEDRVKLMLEQEASRIKFMQHYKEVI